MYQDLQDPEDVLDPMGAGVPGESQVLRALKETPGTSESPVPRRTSPWDPPEYQDHRDLPEYQDHRDPRESQAAAAPKGAEEIEETRGSSESRVLLVPTETPDQKDQRERGARRAAPVTLVTPVTLDPQARPPL